MKQKRNKKAKPPNPAITDLAYGSCPVFVVFGKISVRQKSCNYKAVRGIVEIE